MIHTAPRDDSSLQSDLLIFSVSTDRPTQETHNTGISDSTQPLRQSQEKYSFLKTNVFCFLILAAKTVGRGCALGF